MSSKLLSLTYKYKLPPGQRGATPSADAQMYPLVVISIGAPGGKPREFEGLLDSGADTIFIPNQVAKALELPELGREQMSGVMKSAQCIKTRITLTVGASGSRRVNFKEVDAVFPAEPNDIPILVGRHPVFKYFEITFEEYKDIPRFKLVQKKPI